MATVIVIGAGLAGLSTALFLARRGHHVEVLESDPPPPSDVDHESNFRIWNRKGVGQARQSHNFMGLSSAVLARQAPDVLDELGRSGATMFDYKLADRDGTPAPILFARRTTYERVLRQAVEQERQISFHSGEIVERLKFESGDPPLVTGVSCRGEKDFRADITIDCTGRRSRAASWLQRIGARALVEETHPCGLMYFTRWYRLRAGTEFPHVAAPAFARLSYMNLFVCHGDSETFSVTFTVSESDPARRALRDPARFDRAAAAIPLAAAFLDRSEPETAPLPFGAISNGRRSLLDKNGPVVEGYLLLGDSLMHTNPTLGRGVSLAFAQAERLADLLDGAPTAFAAAFEAWSDRELRIWFDTQVETDLAYSDQCAAIANGKPPPELPSALRAQRALFAAIAQDPYVEHVWRRLMNLLIRPDELRTDERFAAALKAQSAAAAAAPGPSDVLKRKDFEDLVAN